VKNLEKGSKDGLIRASQGNMKGKERVLIDLWFISKAIAYVGDIVDGQLLLHILWICFLLRGQLDLISLSFRKKSIEPKD
jgi:hypothetical protein